jgi:hemerythrin-like domain-containing protein
MPVQIGMKTHDFSDPIGLLSDCHRRIEMFLGSLEAVGSIIDHPPLENTVLALGTALRYFREAAPKHTADEEKSLFPRLRATRSPEIESTMARLEHREEEHQRITFLHTELDELGERYLSDGALSGAKARRYRETVADLKAIYQRHIHMEDSSVFPIAARVLPQSDKAAIGSEMAGRRRRDPMRIERVRK